MAFNFGQIKQILTRIPVPSPEQRRVLVGAMMTPPATGVAKGLGGIARKAITVSPFVGGKIGGAVSTAARDILRGGRFRPQVPKFKAGGTAVRRREQLTSTLKELD